MIEDKIELYKIWAPDNALWTQWAKPAMFFNFSRTNENSFTIPDVKWLEESNDTMIIVDFEGEKSVREGIALAKEGHRPVPLYNGVKGYGSSLVNVTSLEQALYWGGEILKDLQIKKNARPVFLLDANRMKENRHPGVYDNRWCIFPQDMPSADFLIKNGIKKIILRAKNNFIQDDLSHILCRYQEKKIKIYICDGEEVKEIRVRRPSRYKSLKYRLFVILKLKRNSAGGFGGYVPDPTQYYSGTGYRGIG